MKYVALLRRKCAAIEPQFALLYLHYGKKVLIRRPEYIITTSMLYGNTERIGKKLQRIWDCLRTKRRAASIFRRANRV